MRRRPTWSTTQAARRTFLRDAPADALCIEANLWIRYRMWVDSHLTAVESSTRLFHQFVASLALGVHAEPSWNGSNTADLVACLARGGLLADTWQPPELALENWLQARDQRQDGLIAFYSLWTSASFPADALPALPDDRARIKRA
eukprot:6202227-Pleurochrysis_carterae.AAC.3